MYTRTHKGFLPYAVFAAAVLFFAAYSWCIPRMIDDWVFLNWYREAMRGDGLLSKAAALYTELNGRIVGNSLMLFLCGSKLLFTLFRTLVYSVLLYAFGRLSGLAPRGGLVGPPHSSRSCSCPIRCSRRPIP